MSRRIPDAESTAYPWWVIIDPRQMMRPSVSAVAHMVTGPFFSREAAQAHLEAKRHRFGADATVWCHTGHDSADWRALCEEPATTENVDE